MSTLTILMLVTVTYNNETGTTTKTGYINGSSVNNCLQTAIDSVKKYAISCDVKIVASGTKDYPGYWTNELQPVNFWEDPTAKYFTGPERKIY